MVAPYPFSPRLLDKETLEKLFVQRKEVLERIVELVKESASTESKHHQLVVGAAGLGKTHLAALACRRLSDLDIAWLREQEWGVTSFLDLLLGILEAMGMPTAPLLELDPEDAEREAGELLEERFGRGTLIVVAENLQALFDGMGDDGQRKLRAYMQEHPFISMLATSRSLFNGVSKRTAPFYGTFSIYHLEELDDEGTALLMEKIGHADMEGSLVRAFRHLAGGNPRICTLFARHLDRGFTDALLRTIDDLMPIYRSWMEALPSQPRKIVDLLCRLGSSATVGEIAKHCFLKHQTASSQLKLLRDRGYVQATSVGRESHYEISDPIMKLCSELKQDRGESLRQLAEFVRLWYEGEDDAAEAVRSLLTNSNMPERWFQGARTLLETMREDLPKLAQGIARSAAFLKSNLVSTEGARIWLGVWKEVGQNALELKLCLKLLDAAVRYIEEPDPRVLLSLAREEREILRQLLEVSGL